MNNIIRRPWQQAEAQHIEDLRGAVFEAEQGAHTFEIYGVDTTGAQIPLSGTVSGTFMRPDNTDEPLTGSISGGVAILTLSPKCYQVPGRFGLTIFLTSGGSKTAIYAAIGTVARSSTGNVSPDTAASVETLIARINAAVASIPQDYSALSKSVPGKNPELRNGSTGNPSNTDAITTQYVIKLDPEYEEILVEYIGATDAAEYQFGYCLFKGCSDADMSYNARSTASEYLDRPNQISTTKKHVLLYTESFGDYTHIAFVLWASDANGNRIPLRIATDQGNLRITFRHAAMEHENISARQAQTDVRNAARTDSMLRLVHLSDIHGDSPALNRIMHLASVVAPDADIICTGDLRENHAGTINSWWDKRVMTCIGNHDSASYSSGTYDWTALSMADREAYYITPYIGAWGAVSHPSGTSYYYKDYPDQHVRLIVIDCMLYMGTPGSEATAQTAWLADALASAWANSLHVLIATHAPHGGAEPVPCGFTKRGQTTMPVNSDCDTPQVVIDTVAAAINNGLHFIGYICGHTHQDGIWDATGDRSQLMYCVTCANSGEAGWRNSDQRRSDEQDAVNVVVIDTEKSLIKIIRAGGANRAEYLQTRDTLLIDYSTGAVLEPDESMPAITIGNVTTLNSDQNASVSIRGTTDAPVLDFGIPRGPAGTMSNATGESINVSSSDNTPIATRLAALATQLNTIESMELPAVRQEAQAERLLVVSGTVSSLPATLSHADITADHVVVQASVSPVYVQKSNWTVVTSAGQAVISGTMEGSATVTLVLGKKKGD